MKNLLTKNITLKLINTIVPHQQVIGKHATLFRVALTQSVDLTRHSIALKLHHLNQYLHTLLHVDKRKTNKYFYCQNYVFNIYYKKESRNYKYYTYMYIVDIKEVQKENPKAYKNPIMSIL